MSTTKYDTIDGYIKSFPKNTQLILEQIRATVKEAVPAAEETIKYDMPTFVHEGANLIHFAAFKSHIGFYAAPTGEATFAKALAVYKTGKGSVQFPLDKPMPLSLIARIVKWNRKRNAEKAKKKK